MAYIGKVPTAVPLTTSDLADGIVTVSKLATTLDLSSNTITLPSGVGGKVLQVVSTTKLDTFSVGGTGISAVTGLSLSITPSSTSNKVFIVSNFCGKVGDYGGGFLLYRDGSSVATPSSIGSRTGIHSAGYHDLTLTATPFVISYLDSPSSTSALTYQIYVNARSNTVYHVNKSSDDTDTSDRPRTIATITAYEIAG